MNIGDAEFVIAGFIRDVQMNSTLASSKRFLVNAADYEKMRCRGEEEYLIEFVLDSGSDINELSSLGADVTGIADYIVKTYGQTLDMVDSASKAAIVTGAMVTAVVVMLFMKLITEKKWLEISLQKALGFKSGDIMLLYFAKGIIPAVVGIVIGVLAANILGEVLCGVVLKLFGADSFRFVIEDNNKNHPKRWLLIVYSPTSNVGEYTKNHSTQFEFCDNVLNFPMHFQQMSYDFVSYSRVKCNCTYIVT